MSEISEKWDLIKEAVRDEYEISNVSFATWIKPLNLAEVNGDTIVISISSDNLQHFNYISKKFNTYFKVVISEMFDHDYDIVFKLEKDLETSESIPSVSNNVYNINSENANLNSKYKFDTFVVGGNNQMAHAASLAVAESPGTVYNPLFIYGGAGLGKTHLMHAIGHFILQHNPEKKVLYVPSDIFVNELIESIRSGDATSVNKIRDKYKNVDVLMVDDVQFIIGKEQTQAEFFHIFNTLHTAGKQIIISSDKPPKKMEILEDRFRSRFEWGLIADIQPPDYETRLAILMKNAEINDKKIDKSIIEYIAANVYSNIRELEGALTKVLAYAKLNNVELTLEAAEEALKDVIYPNKPVIITPSYIIDVVAEHYGIKSDLIKSKKRDANISLPRQVAMYLCCELTDSSLKEIGKVIGNKDHTTVMHGRDKIIEDIKKDPDLASKIEIIKSKLSTN